MAKIYDFETMLRMDAEWCKQLGFSDFDGLNKVLRSEKTIQLVNLCEARHENDCSTIANDIVKKKKRLILIAGPSSSGKTSTSLRIALQCKVHGLNPYTIELDNYFQDREKTPKLPNGQYDYECLEAMDLELLNKQLIALAHGDKVELPRYDFYQGKKVFEGNYMQLHDDDILILEGIHALDPAMTPKVPAEYKYHLYVSDVSAMSEFDPCFDTADNRLLRRIVRDSRSRGINTAKTLLGWQNVRDGEEKYIFPFQNRADAAFNSTVAYELPLMKLFVTPKLLSIGEDSPAYKEAQRLLSFLNKIDALPLEGILAIPCTSIMREFTGEQYLSRNLL